MLDDSVRSLNASTRRLCARADAFADGMSAASLTSGGNSSRCSAAAGAAVTGDGDTTVTSPAATTNAARAAVARTATNRALITRVVTTRTAIPQNERKGGRDSGADPTEFAINSSPTMRRPGDERPIRFQINGNSLEVAERDHAVTELDHPRGGSTVRPTTSDHRASASRAPAVAAVTARSQAPIIGPSGHNANMPGQHANFPVAVARSLSTAEFSMRHVAPGDHRKLYDLVRVTMTTIAPVDSFYIGMLGNDNIIVIPYVFDDEGFEHPGFHTYGPDGLTAWITANARAYRYADDQGRLLHKGHVFGDHERVSADAVTVPLLEDTPEGPRVAGLASMLTYQPNAYDDETVRAFEWLARRLMRALEREREDADDMAGVATGDERATLTHASVAGVVEVATHRLMSIQATILDALQNTEPGPDDRGVLRQVHERCATLQTDLAELLLHPTADGGDLLSTLTPREREVAGLIAEGLTNDDIASRLVISEKTAKTHVTRVLKKFGVRQRSGVAAKLRPF